MHDDDAKGDWKKEIKQNDKCKIRQNETKTAWE